MDDLKKVVVVVALEEQVPVMEAEEVGHFGVEQDFVDLRIFELEVGLY